MGLLSRQPSRVRAVKARVYELIDRATSEYLSAPNFALNTDVASAINGSPEQGYAANKACKHLKGRLLLKNPRVQHLALQLLEHCVRSCGDTFHLELAKSELFVELLHMSDRSSWCTPQVQSQVLALLQEWAYMLRPAQFLNAYNKLKARGVPFPPREGTPKFEPYPGLSPPPPLPPGHHHSHPHRAQGVPLPPEDAVAPAGPPQLLSPSQPPAKLREDLAVAGNTVALLQEMLDGVPPDNFGAAKEDYVMDMVAQCREMKDRLTRLIGQLDDEGLMATALQLNDDAQAAMDRHADMVAVAEGRRRPPPQAPRAQQQQPQQQQQQPQQPQQKQPVAAASAAGASPPAAPASAGAGKPGQPQPLLDLLSLDAWGPSEPAPAYPPVSTQMTGGVDPFAAPMPIPAPAASNNPFAAPVPVPTPVLPPAAAAAPPPPAAPATSAAARAPAPSDNPFFSDTAFAAAVHPPAPPQPQPQANQSPPPAWGAGAAAAHSSPGPAYSSPGADVAGSGNPFAAPTPAPAPPAVAPVAVGVEGPLSPARPPPPPVVPQAAVTPAPLQPAGSFTGYPSPAAPLYSPVYPGSLYSSPSPFGPVATPPHVGPGPYGRPLSDAFGDLVRLAPKEEPAAPPPPRGTPMRTAAGCSPEPSSTAPAPAHEKSALSAFDAFDELLADRSSGAPSHTTSTA